MGAAFAAGRKIAVVLEEQGKGKVSASQCQLGYALMMVSRNICMACVGEDLTLAIVAGHRLVRLPSTAVPTRLPE